MLEHDFDLFSVDPLATQAASETGRYLADSQHHLGRMLELMPIGVLIHSEQSIVSPIANQQTTLVLEQTSSEAITFSTSLLRPTSFKSRSAWRRHLLRMPLLTRSNVLWNGLMAPAD
jgi:hypothetical protein